MELSKLESDYMYRIGDFQILLSENEDELKVFVNAKNKYMLINPNSDNSSTILAVRSSVNVTTKQCKHDYVNKILFDNTASDVCTKCGHIKKFIGKEPKEK